MKRDWTTLREQTLVFLLSVLMLTGCDDVAKLGIYAYPETTVAGCDPGAKTGPVGGASGETTLPQGYAYTVRTPANYRPSFAHPLIVVYAPAGLRAAASERGTGLTEPATAAGFVIAYAAHAKATIPVIEELSTIPSLIAAKWCIDPSRVFLTGHSDGGTVAQAIAILEKTKHVPTAIAPSAAGFTKGDLADFSCRTPLPVLVFHSAKDALFPGFGADAAAWWAKCNQCNPSPRPGANGCVVYPECANGVTTEYCEGSAPHPQWPAMNAQLIAFFAAAGHAKPALTPMQ